jgi:hypothetical protein
MLGIPKAWANPGARDQAFRGLRHHPEDSSRIGPVRNVASVGARPPVGGASDDHNVHFAVSCE